MTGQFSSKKLVQTSSQRAPERPEAKSDQILNGSVILEALLGGLGVQGPGGLQLLPGRAGSPDDPNEPLEAQMSSVLATFGYQTVRDQLVL